MTPLKPLRFGEFIALLALLMATAAFSTDAMLPSIGAIGADLSPDAPERAAMVLTVFLLGLGTGTLIMGPLSDSFGRKPVMLAGIALYMVAAVAAALSNSLTMLLVARFVQGLGSSGPRVVCQAMVRDLYNGRMMARVVSFGFTIFALIPAVAPLIGAGISATFGWRAIFWSFLVFGTVSALWLGLRQPETLPPARRLPLNLTQLWAALREVLGHPRVRLYLASLTLVFSSLFLWLSQVSLIFDVGFDRASEFPLWFAAVAVLAAPSSLMNARLVMKFGMRALVWGAIMAMMTISALVLVLMPLIPEPARFWLFMLFMVTQFSAIGFLMGNLNALILEPMGHLAGMASSLVNGLGTILASAIVTPLTPLFDGSTLPLALGVLVASVLNAFFMVWARRH